MLYVIMNFNYYNLKEIEFDEKIWKKKDHITDGIKLSLKKYI